MTQSKENEQIIEILDFKDYFKNLEDGEKKSLIFQVVPLYFSIGNFYRKIREKGFRESEFLVLESITGLKFKRYDSKEH